jgi:hypothetical protein
VDGDEDRIGGIGPQRLGQINGQLLADGLGELVFARNVAEI